MESTVSAAERPKGGKKPVGGFRFVTVFQVCMVWSAYMAGHIRYRDLRVYFACHEVSARRCRVGRGEPTGYTLGELHKLVGGVGGEHVKASLRRLEATGLLCWSAARVAFAESPDELRIEDLTGLWAMLDRLAQRNRKAPVPRRTLRFIAGGARRVVAATMLGHVLRCCYVKGGVYSPEGSCAASWIASVFGIDERNVKGARKHLVSIGWLLPIASDAWHRQKHGARAIVNPTWRRPVDLQTSVAEGSHDVRAEGPAPTEPPPQTVNSTTKPPPLLNLKEELLSEYKNQKPALAADRPTGACSKPKTEKLPTMQHVELKDLSDTSRTLQLFDNAVGHNLITDCEADRLNFVAAADRAITVGTSNPAGLFVRIVRAKLWHHITQDDETAAHRRLKRHFFGVPVSEQGRPEGGPRGAVPPRPPAVELSEDARLVSAVTQVGRQYRVGCEPFHLLRRERPDWTRERWEHAEAELANARLQRVASTASHSC